LLINLTNNAWFGQTYAPYLHRLLAAFRAVENRVYLVRATNTGLTSIIDPLGREQTPLAMFQPGTLVRDIPNLHIPTVYNRWGDGFAQLCSLCAMVVSMWSWQRDRRLRHASG
jgi:apolipoprotein N-acyltransferase